jgi:hypothetical protein
MGAATGRMTASIGTFDLLDWVSWGACMRLFISCVLGLLEQLLTYEDVRLTNMKYGTAMKLVQASPQARAQGAYILGCFLPE